MNLWQLSNRTSLYFAFVTEKVWVFYIHRTSLNFYLNFFVYFFRNVKIGVLLETSNFFIIFNWTYWFISLVIVNSETSEMVKHTKQNYVFFFHFSRSHYVTSCELFIFFVATFYSFFCFWWNGLGGPFFTFDEFLLYVVHVNFGISETLT